MKNVKVEMSNIDWPLLREQKAWLEVQQAVEPAEGLLHLLDSLMDQAAEILGDHVVFGPEEEEE